jgi:predicted secreted protein
MSKKDKKIVLVAQCLVNPYCRVHILGQNFPLSMKLMDYLLGHKVGVIQYACPETTAMGLMRNPQGRQQYDNIFFRSHCKELLQTPMLMVREFIKNGYRLCCFIGLENSPTCGIHWGKHKVNRYQTESPNAVASPSAQDPVLMGIMAEILQDELGTDAISVPFLEFPAVEPGGSERIIKFWEDLSKIIDPFSSPEKSPEKENESA